LNIYSCIASYFSSTKVVPTINGLGVIFNKTDVKRKIVEFLYKLAFLNTKLVLFQNQDDRDIFCNSSIIHKKYTAIINGSGINTNSFPLKKYELLNYPHKFIFTYCGRLIREKGCIDFLKAAQILTEKYKNVVFQVYGVEANNPNAISKEEILSYQKQDKIFFNGRTDDVNTALENSDVLVYPSYYREGIPKILIEGLSKGLPIITCNSVGCRETVIDNKNGYLVIPNNIDDLVKKLDLMINLSADSRMQMGLKSREFAIEKFDEKIIIQKYLDIVYLITG
jgi:glycosyltransferase involved in cell wall biosynthesis